MKVRFINPFLVATKDVVIQVLGSSPNFEKPFIKSMPFNSDDLLVIIGVTGEMNGRVLINIDKRSCIKIASQMMGGMSFEFNEISKSAVGELCNMILGTTATLFAKEGININITSPTIIAGTNITVSHKEQIICVPVNISNDIKLIVNISTERKVA